MRGGNSVWVLANPEKNRSAKKERKCRSSVDAILHYIGQLELAVLTLY